MQAPESFLRSLDRQFNRQLRCRWSDSKHEWVIEQKFRRAKLSARRIETGAIEEDDLIRARDGFAHVLSVRPGNRMPCPKCGIVLGIPELRMKRSTCPRCGASFLAVYYPLGDMLLEHLRYTDPYRDGLKRMFDAQEDAEKRVQERQARDRRSQGEALWKDQFNRIAGIQSVGYTPGDRRVGKFDDATERSIV